ncbi:RNA polymerase sigma-70 factor (ECF subfamily) [Aquimarina sp. EL_43]|uniref:sigma-70 family RNA polymerase sigma factor n=1 Tax=Aquimarina TaxID=290174 RepID=UPI00046FAFD9|nr:MULTISPECIES: sigma-70 family RNA polymerase sigma factor [Aquimarina]MBG6130705.1 RNA polymerase sigma-70 factor (ECF subfamily) [Aquimarina sp. EL_35]MBG6151149.1 RNA polymerase sigma-70 factor (ECF subfamily) [Aquimarina sp. EL_32]MBG6169107.1 RNA polymerase sigma-70 factor (ECF subfamily) [Aquimarina sp. EL_43]
MKFENIWEEHKKPLLNFIKTRVDDNNIGEDIVQDVGIKLHTALYKNQEINNYKSWLFQVARNTIADYYRKNKIPTTIIKDQPEIAETSMSGTCVCDLSGFVIQNYLPKQYADALYLSDIEQKPQKEIAKILDLSLTATKSRIQRGRKKLKELVTDCIEISYNNKGQITGFLLKDDCELPPELITQIDKLNLTI